MENREYWILWNTSLLSLECKHVLTEYLDFVKYLDFAENGETLVSALQNLKAASEKPLQEATTTKALCLAFTKIAQLNSVCHVIKKSYLQNVILIIHKPLGDLSGPIYQNQNLRKT